MTDLDGAEDVIHSDVEAAIVGSITGGVVLGALTITVYQRVGGGVQGVIAVLGLLVVGYLMLFGAGERMIPGLKTRLLDADEHNEHLWGDAE